MNKFIVKGAKFSTSSAISEVINSNGNLLTLAYGYITDSKITNFHFKEILSAIDKNPDLKVEIYLGLLFTKTEEHKKKSAFERKKDFIADHKRQIEETVSVFENLLPSKSLPLNISIFGVPHFHAKFCLMEEDLNDRRGVAGVMGSSNLSYTALSDITRIELDVFMSGGANNSTLQSFTASVNNIITNAENSKFVYVEGNSKEITYENTQNNIKYIEDLEKLFECQTSWEEENNIMYSDSSDEDRRALIESDLELGVYYK